MNAKKDAPSTAQERAIEARERHLLVSASAGSGKTYTLVERIVRNIVEGVYGIDELLVVTFTGAAAAEMRERIEKKLTEAMGAHPELSRQIVLLAGASISTFHSFCQRLIRDNVAALDVSPKFRLISGAEWELLRYRVVERLFEEKYEARDAGFLDFVGKYGSDRDDENLYDMTLRLAEFAQSRPDPAAWLESLENRFALAEGTSFEDTIWYPELRLHIGRTLSACADAARYLTAHAEKCGLGFYADALRSDGDKVERLYRAFGSERWEPLAKAFKEVFSESPVFDKLNTPRGLKMNQAEKSFLDKARNKEIKDPIKRLFDAYFSADAATMLDDVRAAGAEAAELCRLASDFLRAFREEKRKKETLDFNDLEHLTLELLSNEEMASSLRARYKEIMVDEYQDTNGVQEAILDRITNGRNLFMVGDVKQSIYRFRLADPTLFTQKQETKDGTVECLELGENYRSRPEILTAVNFFFAQLMRKPEVELDYDAKAKLTPKADYPETEGVTFAGAPVELLLVEKRTGGEEKDHDAEEGEESLEGFAAEAEVIARRLRELKESGVEVYDKDERAYHPVRWRDMAILLRAKKGGKPQKILEALRAHDIPAYAEADAGYFAETEVRLMLSLLTVIDNAHQDIPLAAVLRSAVVGMTAEELAALRTDAPSGDSDFYDALVFAAKDGKNAKAGDFLKRLARWRSLSRRIGVPELLWRLYRETGYYDYAGAQPGGLVRQANLRMLADRAADYEKTNFRGLFRFLQFVRRMKERGTDLSVARTLGENEDVVRVMTVHKSKGLEYPVVVLAGLASGFNFKDASADFLIHKELGLGLYRTETKGTLTWRYPTIARRAVAERIKREAQAEEMRVLYVALTRAREKLILTGTVPSLAMSASMWCRNASRRETKLPGHAVLGAGSWLNWIGMAMVRSDAGAELREAAGFDEPVGMEYDAEVFGTPRFDVRVLSAPSVGAETESGDDREWMKLVREKKPLPVPEVPEHQRALSWRYDFPTDIPAKMTVTEIKRRFSEPEDELPLIRGIVPPPDDLARDFPPPAFLAEAARRDGAAFGTLMHAVLQRLRLDGALDEADIGAQLDALVRDGQMDEEERRAVRDEALARFFASPLGRRMRAARRVWREQPFSLLLPAAEIGLDAPEEDEVFVQGVIDVFFEEEDGGFVLLDYKTDRHTTPEFIRGRYRRQLELYARAIRSILGKKVDEIYIYRLADGDAVKV